MAMFVHLAFESDLKSISKNGIAISKFRKCVFAMPVGANFYISHQWLRELKRNNGKTVLGVYFRINDNERVFVGRYNKEHQEMSAAEAGALANSEDEPLGYEVLINRRIDRREIFKIKRLPQNTGWRYYPESHGKEPCPCPVCQRGQYGANGIRRRSEEV